MSTTSRSYLGSLYLVYHGPPLRTTPCRCRHANHHQDLQEQLPESSQEGNGMVDSKIRPPYSRPACIAHQQPKRSHQHQQLLLCWHAYITSPARQNAPDKITTSTLAPLHDAKSILTVNASAWSTATRLLTLQKGHHLLAAGSATSAITRGSSCPRGRADVFRLAFLAT